MSIILNTSNFERSIRLLGVLAKLEENSEFGMEMYYALCGNTWRNIENSKSTINYTPSQAEMLLGVMGYDIKRYGQVTQRVYSIMSKMGWEIVPRT